MKRAAHDIAGSTDGFRARLVRAVELETLDIFRDPTTFVEVEKKKWHDDCPKAFGDDRESQ